MPGMASLQSHNGYLCHFEIANSEISAWSKLSKQERQMVENAITLHGRIHAMKSTYRYSSIIDPSMWFRS
jgi:pyridoxine/pyridoxamine 5'-phosphate oxidase